jgi:hypothetical protein
MSITGNFNQGRRRFLTSASMAAGAAMLPHSLQALGAAPATANGKMIDIQIGAISFVDEGVNKVLDILQEKGSVNTLFISSFTYDP